MSAKTLITEKGLVDTNILVYWVDGQEPGLHKKSLEFFETVLENPKQFVIALQNLREFCSVVIRKKKISISELETALSTLPESFNELLPETVDDICRAAQISVEQQTPFFDTLLATTMQRHGISTIYTENTRDFKKLGLRVVNPLK